MVKELTMQIEHLFHRLQKEITAVIHAIHYPNAADHYPRIEMLNLTELVNEPDSIGLTIPDPDWLFLKGNEDDLANFLFETNAILEDLGMVGTDIKLRCEVLPEDNVVLIYGQPKSNRLLTGQRRLKATVHKPGVTECAGAVQAEKDAELQYIIDCQHAQRKGRTPLPRPKHKRTSERGE